MNKITESTIEKFTIELLEKQGYEIYLIDEYKTSKICNGCENELEKFMKHKIKINEIEKEVLCHGLLRCTSENCKIIHNRDKNNKKHNI